MIQRTVSLRAGHVVYKWEKNCIGVLVENSERQWLLGRSIRRWEDNELALKQREKNCKLD